MKCPSCDDTGKMRMDDGGLVFCDCNHGVIRYLRDTLDRIHTLANYARSDKEDDAYQQIYDWAGESLYETR